MPRRIKHGPFQLPPPPTTRGQLPGTGSRAAEKDRIELAIRAGDCDCPRCERDGQQGMPRDWMWAAARKGGSYIMERPRTWAEGAPPRGQKARR